MSWSQTDLDKLESAIGKGVRSVTFQTSAGMRRMDFHSLDEMLRLRNEMRAEVAGTSAPVTRYASFRRGA
ncbi:phage head-tail joining protein [Methylobrevis pamukkalensis]|uniref:Uncharacterized protein n=1 Tax=Methylobrevis pamukkalensis TaxID=1439726 RepID=A0A1E3GZS4_9HYPH|nr:hypothetical protein [Methylobrevis pamukkalensis]ODN69544.1 hypothetical protein A6302_03138 [Methylobrevis pamukkalensis]